MVVSSMEAGKGTRVAAAVVAVVLLLLAVGSRGEIRLQELQYGFYAPTCPQAERIVHSIVAKHYNVDPNVAAGLLRLHFHDCFVRGCDGSILLDETPSGVPTEKFSPGNGDTLYGLDIIDEIKLQLESECPNTVSCADILAFAARDGTTLAGLPAYSIPAGRRDGRVSRADDISTNLPLPDHTVKPLTRLFASKGLNQTEMVILSGAHSIGGAHCLTFSNRLYKYKPDMPLDPSLNIIYSSMLRVACPKTAKLELGSKVPFDTETPLQLDSKYYETLLKGRGLLRSDQALMQTKETRRLVRILAENPDMWAKEFARAMIKVGAVDVLVGEEGEIRTTCTRTNAFLAGQF